MTTIIPTWTNDRAQVSPSAGSAWMLPFVTPAYRDQTLTPVNPSITPIVMSVSDGVEMWWRWERLNVTVYGIAGGFGERQIELTRRILGTEEPVLDEKNLAKKEACLFKGSGSFTIGLDSLGISIEILILPPKDTPFGNDTTGEFTVDESYGISEGDTPETCNCLPRIVITIALTLDTGTELLNYLTNYGVADEAFNASFNGNSIILNNATGGTSVFDSVGLIVADIVPSQWYSWNGTWNTATGERN